MQSDAGYITFIANPKSGATSRKLLCQMFRKYLQDHGFDVRFHVTQSLEHACDLAIAAGTDTACALVVAAGGDGTIREVAHGMEGVAKPLLVVPSGTENLLASELGFDENPQTLIRTFEAGYTRPLDLGLINGKCFTCVVGFGFDADVVEKVCRARQGHIDYFDYFDPLWQTFWGYRFRPLYVELDGRQVFEGPGLAFVGNVSRYALGLQILGEANYGDGLLDLCIFKCAGRIHLIKHSALTMLKCHATCGDVVYGQGKEVTVLSTDPSIKTQVDGDPGPALPARIGIVPQALHVMVPEDAKPAGIRTRIIRALG